VFDSVVAELLLAVVFIVMLDAWVLFGLDDENLGIKCGCNEEERGGRNGLRRLIVYSEYQLPEHAAVLRIILVLEYFNCSKKQDVRLF
jgi:hypothetical protein